MRNSTGSIKESQGTPSVGDRVEVWWKDDKKYYPGQVVSQQANGKVKVHYDDGDKESLDFRKERWRVINAAQPETKPTEPPRKRASAAARAKASPTATSRKRSMSGEPTATANSDTGSAKRARNDDDTTPTTTAIASPPPKKSVTASMKPSMQAEDPVVSSTAGATSNSTTAAASAVAGSGTVAVASPSAGAEPSEDTVTLSGVADVVTTILSKESVEWRKRNSALQRRLTAVEQKLAEATSEISALRGQLAVLRAVSPSQATAAKEAVREVFYDMARSVLGEQGEKK